MKPQSRLGTFRIIAKLLLGALACGCSSSSDVENRILETVASPNQSFVAVVYERNAGATTGFNRQVTIIKSGNQLGKHDDVESFFCVLGDPKIKVNWVSETNLLVRFPEFQRIIRTNSQVGKIAVSYEQN
jgi:hypothetical protein